MQDIFVKIKPAIDFAAGEKTATVVLKDRKLIGTNGHMTAVAPIDCDLDFKVDAELFDKALKVMPNPKLRKTEKTLFMEQGKTKAKFVLSEEKIRYFIPENLDSYPRILLKRDLKAAISMLLPFIGDDHMYLWQVGISCFNKKMYATTGAYLIELDYDIGIECMLPARAVQYILARDAMAICLTITEKEVVLTFDDGTLLSCTKTPEEKVEKIAETINASWQEPMRLVDEEFRQAVETVRALDGQELILDEQGIVALNKSAELSFDFASGAKAPTYWSANLLANTLAVSTHIDIEPKGDNKMAFFKGDKVRGILLRRDIVWKRASSQD